jgi:hypothetical protein
MSGGSAHLLTPVHEKSRFTDRRLSALPTSVVMMRLTCREKDRIRRAYEQAMSAYAAALRRAENRGETMRDVSIRDVTTWRDEMDGLGTALRVHCAEHGCAPALARRA